MKTLKNFNFQNKKVLLRTNFDVPLSDRGSIRDDFRIKASISTIEYLIKNRAKIIVISHLGRPKKREEKFSLKPVANRLGELLNKRVKFVDGLSVKKIKSGDIVVLENLRFYKQEKENNSQFAKQLARLSDIYINDAFAVCHREHASIVGIPKYLPSGIGLLIEKEIKILDQILKNSKRPFITIIGGKKVETKVKFIDKISEISDFVLIGGLIPKEIEKQKIKFKEPEKIILPVDWIDSGDIGEKTIKIFNEKIKTAKTIFWNGPLGKTEEEKFSKATKEVAKAVVKSKAFSVIGGGETIEFLTRIGLIKKFSFVSTGGGAMLDYIVDSKLVGLEALKFSKS
ncbi:phosphoglycerate kinase [Candidatus Parcubacteria bacterium]|nr:phosphoglycerate kinase [Candidatus Parcubacteria bacterium]